MSDFIPDKSRFRSPGGNRYLQALFFETTREDKSTVVYTLKDHDHLGYPSLYRLYMETADPLEWRFATTYLDSMEHWEMLCNANWFLPYVTRWRHELELRLRSEALLRLTLDAESSSKTAMQSNKHLLDKGWIEKSAKGRPSKAQIKQEAQRQATLKQNTEDDLNRMIKPN